MVGSLEAVHALRGARRAGCCCAHREELAARRKEAAEAEALTQELGRQEEAAQADLDRLEKAIQALKADEERCKETQKSGAAEVGHSCTCPGPCIHTADPGL